MNSIFADTGYWIALLHPKDDLHSKAQAVSSQLGQVRLVTSEMILCEVLNYFADKGAVLRQAAAAFAEQIQNDPNSVVVPQTSLQFRNALRFYDQRQDKSWGLTDCASILIRQAEVINEALAHDINFKQAGFTALLRDD
jgi:uncharacterized protein